MVPGRESGRGSSGTCPLSTPYTNELLTRKTMTPVRGRFWSVLTTDGYSVTRLSGRLCVV